MENELKQAMFVGWDSDEVLVHLKEIYLKEGRIPDEDEAVQTLKFFTVFAMGCEEMGLSQLSMKFKRRVDLYSLALMKMGYGKGWYRTNLFNKHRRSFDRIIATVGRMLRLG